jgi:excisionase family DNA binding protein
MAFGPARARVRGAVEDLRPLLTLAEVAAHFRVHEKTVQRWVRTRGLPCLRLGTRLRFDSGDVLRWLSARREE